MLDHDTDTADVWNYVTVWKIDEKNLLRKVLHRRRRRTSDARPKLLTTSLHFPLSRLAHPNLIRLERIPEPQPNT